MCLTIHEADEIIAAARAKGLVVSVDMHKRYDPDHLRVRDDIQKRIGAPLYGTAYLEEPLEVATSTFKWVESSDPFSYVGPHWTDLIYSYYHSKPVSLTAVGQKKRLIRDGINAYDAVQVRVDFENGLSMNFHNNWITPPEFEGPVNQGHEIVGADGKVESDQQYRGFRWWNQGDKSRTSNNHFTREVARPDGTSAYVGYGVDSLTVGLAAICRVKFHGETRDAVAALYPTAEECPHHRRPHPRRRPRARLEFQILERRQRRHRHRPLRPRWHLHRRPQPRRRTAPPRSSSKSTIGRSERSRPSVTARDPQNGRCDIPAGSCP